MSLSITLVAISPSVKKSSYIKTIKTILASNKNTDEIIHINTAFILIGLLFSWTSEEGPVIFRFFCISDGEFYLMLYVRSHT